MEKFPHEYQVKVTADCHAGLVSTAENLPELCVAPPKQFDGPGDQWSPEELLMASLANCLVLSFRAIARASKLNWTSITCVSTGELDKVGAKVKFTKINTRVSLLVAADVVIEKAEKIIRKSEESCFISNSLSSELTLEIDVKVDS